MPQEFSLFSGRSPDFRDFSTDFDYVKGEEKPEDEKKKRRREIAKKVLDVLPFVARVASAKTSPELQRALSDLADIREARKERQSALEEKERERSFRSKEIQEERKFVTSEREAGQEFSSKQAKAMRQLDISDREDEQKFRLDLEEANQKFSLKLKEFELDVRRDLAAQGFAHDEEMQKQEFANRLTTAFSASGISLDAATDLAETLSNKEELNDVQKAVLKLHEDRANAQDLQQTIRSSIDFINLASQFQIPVRDDEGNILYEPQLDKTKPPKPVTRQLTPGELIQSTFADPQKIAEHLEIQLPDSEIITGTGRSVEEVKAEAEIEEGRKIYEEEEVLKRSAEIVKIRGDEDTAYRWASGLLDDPTMTERKAIGIIRSAGFSENLRRTAEQAVKERVQQQAISESQRNVTGSRNNLGSITNINEIQEQERRAREQALRNQLGLTPPGPGAF